MSERTGGRVKLVTDGDGTNETVGDTATGAVTKSLGEVVKLGLLVVLLSDGGIVMLVVVVVSDGGTVPNTEGAIVEGTDTVSLGLIVVVVGDDGTSDVVGPPTEGCPVGRSRGISLPVKESDGWVVIESVKESDGCAVPCGSIVGRSRGISVMESDGCAVPCGSTVGRSRGMSVIESDGCAVCDVTKLDGGFVNDVG